MNPSEPHSRADILQAIERLQTDGLQFWRTLPPDRFAAPLGEAWSPADNVRHLIKSTKPVTQALALPALVLKTTFGPAKAPSVSFADLRDRYRSVLAGGATAGKFAPAAVAPPTDPAAWQRELVDQCRDALADLAKATVRWSEPELDACRLPHPLLDKLTLREMLFFTLYHYDHHRETVVRRMAQRTE